MLIFINMNTSRICPKCYVELDLDISTKINGCTQCSGKGMPLFLLQTFVKGDILSLIKVAYKKRINSDYMCFECQKPMKKIKLLYGNKYYEPHICKACKLIWFPDKTFELFSGQNSSSSVNIYDDDKIGINKKKTTKRYLEKNRLAKNKKNPFKEFSNLSERPAYSLTKPVAVGLLILITFINLFRNGVINSLAGGLVFSIGVAIAIGYIFFPRMPLFFFIGFMSFFARSDSADERVARAIIVFLSWVGLIINCITSFFIKTKVG